MVRGYFWKFGSFTIGQKFSSDGNRRLSTVHIHMNPVHTRSLFFFLTFCAVDPRRNSQAIRPCNSVKNSLLLQASREDSRTAVTTPPCGGSQRLLEETLQKSAPYPMIVLPPGGGYWLDGQDHDCPFDTRGNPILPNSTWRAKFETDDTAKCYRRFFVGRVSGTAVQYRSRHAS